MKRSLILIIAAVFAVSSCSDFLNKLPWDSIGMESELTPTAAEALVNSAYQPLQWPKFYNMRMWTTDIIAGESHVGGNGGTDGIETVQLANFIADPSNAAAIDIWRGTPGILRANLALKVLPDSDVEEALKKRLIAECKFLRAHYYFILVRFFGDVPLRTEPLFAGDSLSVARTPKAKVYEQIIQDTKDAILDLPYKDEYGAKDLGRACKEAAECQLAKVYLTLGTNYGEVLNLCEDIENRYKENGHNDLSKMPYADNWYNEKTGKITDNGTESIFEVQYSGDPAAGDFWDNDNQTQWRTVFMAPRNAGMVGGSGWGWHHVCEHFVSAYEPGDLRKDVTIFYEGCPDFDDIEYDPTRSTTGYNVRKWCVPTSINDKFDNCPLNTVVYRFADVLLMKAEALNELQETKLAQEPLNKVRARAGLPAVTTEDYNEMRAKIIHERRMELAFEGHRWFDMIRLDGGQYAVDFLKSVGKKNVTLDRLLLPIPQVEIDANNDIKQNPGY